MRRRLPSRLGGWLAAALAIAAATPVVHAEAVSASGTWTVAGTAVKISHARAFREADPFGNGTNPCVLLSNEAVPDEAVPDSDEGISKLLDLMRAGPMRALQVCFDASGKKLRNVNDVFTFHPDVSPGRFALQGFHEFAPKGGAAGIAGKLKGSGTTMDDRPWSDQIELTAEIPEEE